MEWLEDTQKASAATQQRHAAAAKRPERPCGWLAAANNQPRPDIRTENDQC